MSISRPALLALAMIVLAMPAIAVAVEPIDLDKFERPVYSQGDADGVIEYNTTFTPPQSAVIRDHPMNHPDSTDDYGASIQALYELERRRATNSSTRQEAV